MAVDGVTKLTEFTATWNVVNDIISSNITDPLTGQEARGSTVDWVFDGMPNPADIGKPAPKGWKFPIIVIRYPEIDDSNVVVSGTKDMITTTVTIECYARTRAIANALADSVRYILKVTGQNDLMRGALHGPDVISVNQQTDYIGGNKYYGVVIDFEFKRFD